MKLKLVAFGCGLLLVAGFVSASHAQLDRESQLGMSYILGLGGVNQELEMTDEQGAALAGLWFKVQDELQREYMEFRNSISSNTPPEKRKELEQKLASGLEKIRQEESKRIEQVLFEHQIERLTQIRFQYVQRNSEGMQTLKDDLELTDKQISDIKKVAETLKRNLYDLQVKNRENSLSRNELMASIAQARKQSERELLALLTDSQRKKLKEFEGEKFEFRTGEWLAKKRAEEKAKKEAKSKSQSKTDDQDSDGGS